MITVNLKPGARQGGAESKATFAGFRERLSGFSLGIADPLRALVLVAWILVALGLGYFYVKSGSDLTALKPQLEAARAEYALREGFIKQKRQQEGARDSIVSQIQTIRAVDRDRYVWPHILDEVANALPDYTWLTEVSFLEAPKGTAIDTAQAPPPVSFRILGRTGDLQNYTTFLRQLEASPWLTNVMPIEAKTIVDRNRALTSFTIQASFALADSSHIRTVPVLESVVR